MPAGMRIHLDTDIGGDTDDLCALALLLGSADIQLAGITTVADRDGGRLGFLHHALTLTGRTEIPIASGAFGFLGGMPHEVVLNDERYWPALKATTATPAGDAIDLLLRNAQSGATIVAIGPYTNLAIAATLRPGAFRNAEVVVMGGYHRALPAGYPAWDHHRDYNVQADRLAARIVFERLNPLVVPIDVTVQTWLRRAHLGALEAGGPLARLLARQAKLYAAERDYITLAARTPALPGDLLNFQHDPLACAVALGWDCVTIEEVPLRLAERGGSMLFEHSPGAQVRRVAVAVDGGAFAERWLQTVTRL